MRAKPQAAGARGDPWLQRDQSVFLWRAVVAFRVKVFERLGDALPGVGGIDDVVD
jgi:hypothetical protein